MNALLKQWFGGGADTVKGVIAPLFIVMVLAMMVLPLPPLALDVLFTFNIAIALTVMMVAGAHDAAARLCGVPVGALDHHAAALSLNVASTRVVLMQGHTGAAAAGQVIESFGHFLIGGNFAVGLIVFAILVVINFIVVTKGAERIAEVGARFTLDAMPGKQMAIDADLNAGLIDEKEAKRRRLEVGEEAEFFGSMDGASKFVRGDAVAGILILVINIVGGFVIGIAQHDLSAGQAAESYILLAVGDALVAQIPALLISVAAGDGGVARRQATRHRHADRRAGVRLAARAGGGCGHRRHAGHGAWHAAPRVRRHRIGDRLARVLVASAREATRDAAAGADWRGPRRRHRPRRAGMTCSRWTRSALKSAIA